MNLQSLLVALLSILFSCSVQPPDLSGKLAPISAHHTNTKDAINKHLSVITQSFKAFQSLTVVVNTGLSRKAPPSAEIEEVGSPLFATDLNDGDGELHFNDEDEENFEYFIDTDASINLTAKENRLLFHLTGKVKEVDDETRIINSELKVTFLSDDSEQTFRILYQESSPDKVNEEILLKFDLKEIAKLYQMLGKSEEKDQNYQEMEGSLTVRVSNKEIDVTGHRFVLSGKSHTFNFHQLQIALGRDEEETKDLNVNLQITDRADTLVGLVEVSIEETEESPSKVIVKVEYDENGIPSSDGRDS